MTEYLPACGLIPLLWLGTSRSIATEPDAEAKTIFARVH
jgi:hypothetical protein